MADAAAHLFTDIRTGTERLKREIGYNPTYFNQMVGELGPVEATRRLIVTDTPSDGFTKLWEHGRLSMTVEAMAILPWYESLFDVHVRQRARARLEQYGVDIAEYLASALTNTPAWVCEADDATEEPER